MGSGGRFHAPFWRFVLVEGVGIGENGYRACDGSLHGAGIAAGGSGERERCVCEARRLFRYVEWVCFFGFVAVGEG